MMTSRLVVFACGVLVLMTLVISLAQGMGRLFACDDCAWQITYAYRASARFDWTVERITMDRGLSYTLFPPQNGIDPPLISPDGQRIALWQAGALRIRTVDDWANDVVFNSAMTPVWSYDGAQIFMRRETHLYASTDGTDVARITRYDNNVSELLPRPAPDGERLAFQVQYTVNFGQRTEIHIHEANGTSYNISQDHAFNDYLPVWSPDGARIAFIAQRNDTFTLMVMNADGSQRYAPAQLNLSNIGSLAWSPDGTKIALVATRRSGALLYIIDANAQNQSISPMVNQRVESAVMWSPDSAQLAYISAATGAIHILNIAQNEVRVLRDNGFENVIIP